MRKEELIVKRKCGLFWDMDETDFFRKANPVKIMIFVNQMHRRKMEEFLNGTGIHRAQHRLLMTLSENEFESQSELAYTLDISTATVAVSLKKLERDGYIQKLVKEQDSRANFVKLTLKGEEVVEKSKKRIEDLEKQMMDGFSEEELITLRRFLRHIYNNLSEISEERK